MNKSVENSILSNWKLKLGILFAIISPTVTGTAAYYNLRSGADNRISQLELQVEKNYANKNSMEKIQDDVSQMKQDITEIKTLLKRKLK